MTLALQIRKKLNAPLCIGSVSARNRIFLAPMSGISDVPFRRAAWAAGAGMVTSEMVASEALVTGQAEMRIKSESAGLPVHMVQLAGRQAKWLDRAARLAEDNGADIIDINMGCPARRVTTGYSGAALMRDPDHAIDLIKAVVDAVNIPVTLKMRLGWDDRSINAPDIARRAEDAGVAMITVHGRTRCQFYKGKADWRAVRAIRKATGLPLLVNGDIATLDDAIAAIAASGADGAMIGRAAYGQPHLPGMIAAEAAGRPLPGYDMLTHYAEMIGFYGREMGMRCARKHLNWYFQTLPEPVCPDFRHAVMTNCDPDAVLRLLEDLACNRRARAA